MSKALTETVFVLVLLVAASDDPPPPENALLLLAVSATGLSLTRVYAEVVRQKLELRRLLTRAEWLLVIRNSGSPTIAVYLPLALLVLSSFGLISLSLFFALAEWSLVAGLFGYGFLCAEWAGLRSLFGPRGRSRGKRRFVDRAPPRLHLKRP